MKSVSVSALELFREFVFRKIRACFEKCAADETHLAPWHSVGFANAFWLLVRASGWESLQVLRGTAASPHRSPLRLLAGRAALSVRGVAPHRLLGAAAATLSLSC